MRPLAMIAALFLALPALPGCAELSPALNAVWEEIVNPVKAERQEPAKARQESRAKAKGGDAKAQYERFSPLSPSAEGLYWLCRAANGGNAEAQWWLGGLRHLPVGEPWRDAGLVKSDDVRAYMWYSLAVASGDTEAAAARDELTEELTPAQIAEAKRMTADWKPNPSECKRPPTTAASSR